MDSVCDLLKFQPIEKRTFVLVVCHDFRAVCVFIFSPAGMPDPNEPHYTMVFISEKNRTPMSLFAKF